MLVNIRRVPCQISRTFVRQYRSATRRLSKEFLTFFLKGKYLKKDGISTKQGDFPAEGKNIWETFCEIKTRSNESYASLKNDVSETIARSKRKLLLSKTILIYFKLRLYSIIIKDLIL